MDAGRGHWQRNIHLTFTETKILSIANYLAILGTLEAARREYDLNKPLAGPLLVAHTSIALWASYALYRIVYPFFSQA